MVFNKILLQFKIKYSAMNLQNRIDLFIRLGKYMVGNDTGWLEAKEKASHQNPWFIPEFIDMATAGISRYFLQEGLLKSWIAAYPEIEKISAKKIGIVMAGNIPLVGFHDFLCAFIAGHQLCIKPSSKDDVLLRHLISVITEWKPEVAGLVKFADMLKGCDAYIATGSNNSARYFDYYFSKYRHIIRRNRTSVAILRGNETTDELEKLADDVHIYFGRGCRNVTKIFVPENYDFLPLLNAFGKYSYFTGNQKYKNNYDYNLSLLLLNKSEYMSSNATLLINNESIFSPIGLLHYEYYRQESELETKLKGNDNIQCIVGKTIPFGKAQFPSLKDYADGVDTMSFLTSLR